MDSVRGAPGDQFFYTTPGSPAPELDFSQAQTSYDEAINNSRQRHCEVGILTADGPIPIKRLGLDEDYGAHRVGSVTKTFTTFLALTLCKEGVLPQGLQTRCGDVLDEKIVDRVFENPALAKNMTLEQLLTHTSGLDIDDHTALPDQKKASQKPPSTLQDRFIQEGRKYQHITQPGDGIGFYSNAGLAVAGWMMERAYNNAKGTNLSFAEIMKKEVFEGVFKLSESTIAPGPNGDSIQSPAGDMSSSVTDLMKVAICLQQEEQELAPYFGQGWQSNMLKPRDIFGHHGLGCSANASVIAHAGLNREKFGNEERDVTALIQLPLGPKRPGLVAMCDSTALGPKPQEQEFIGSLERLAGISNPEQQAPPPKVDLEFFCPEKGYLFHGNAYLVTHVDPFAKEAPETIICSRNGMRHVLTRDEKRDAKRDGEERIGYKDAHDNPWLVIKKDDGRRIIYSGFCLLTKAAEGLDVAAAQPPAASVKAIQGVYRDAEKPDEHSTYTFTEKNGRLYMQEDTDKDSFPCLYLPDDAGGGGSWVVSNPAGRPIQIRFPQNPDEDFLMITDIFSGVRQLPFYSKRQP